VQYNEVVGMKILMCADGSKISENAIHFGGLLAKAFDAEVVVLHVIENPKFDNSKKILKNAIGILEKFNIKPKTKTRRGQPELKIIDEAKKNYDLIVLGSHGMSSIKRFLFGDVAYRIVQCVEIPALIVRERRNKLRKILMCCGGSKYSREVMNFGVKIARAINAEVTLLHVLPNVPEMFRSFGIDETVEQFLKIDTPESRILKETAKLLEKNSIGANIELRHGFPPEEILKEAEGGDYDMIIIGSHGMFGVRRFLLGAVAYKVVQHSRIPCLLVKPKKFKFLSSLAAYKIRF